MQLCKKPVHSYGRYKQAVQLYMPGSSSPPTAFVEASVEVGEAIVDIGSAILEGADNLAEDFFTTGVTIHDNEDASLSVRYPGVTNTYRESPDPAVPDTVYQTTSIVNFTVHGHGIVIEKTVKTPVIEVPEDAPETDTDDEKKKSTTGD